MAAAAFVVGAIVVAAGAGTRLGADRPKAFVELLDEPLYAHACRAAVESGAVDVVVVVVPDGLLDEATRVLRHVGVLGSFPLAVVAGGPSRQASVANGLAVLGTEVDVVVIHDAARALAPPGLFRAIVAAMAAGHDAVVPGIDVPDTVKQVGVADALGARPVRATLDRAALRLIQTPQGFRREALARAHLFGAARAATEHTAAGDDAGLVEALGDPVHVIPGDPLAFKVTTAHDLLIAAAFVENS